MNNQQTQNLLNRASELLKDKKTNISINKHDTEHVNQQMKMRTRKIDKDVEELKFLIPNEQYIHLRLINSTYQKIKPNYAQFPTCSCKVSLNNKIQQRKESKKKLITSEINGHLLDDYQQQIYKIFNTTEQIHFIFKNEMNLDIHVIQHQIGSVFREDKNIYEAQLIELFEEENDKQDQIREKSQQVQYRFSFLNYIQRFQLFYNNNVPPVLKRQYNIYLILRELIIQVYEENSEQSTFNSIASPQSENLHKIKQIERKVRAQVNKVKRKIRSSPIEHLLNIDSLKDFRIQTIPHNQGYQAQRAIKDYLKESTNTNLQAGSKLGKGGIDKVQKGEYFLKQKGKKNEYHICWLEQRGFHLVWYHTKNDISARGIGQLDDVSIKDIDNTYQVKLLDRSLSIKIEKPYIGLFWRKALAHQIAYKTYLNNLWFNCRVVDKAPIVQLVDYFFEGSTKFLAEGLCVPLNIMPLSYTCKYIEITFESFTFSKKLYEVDLSNCNFGMIGIAVLFKYLKSVERLKILNLSNCQINSCISLTEFLLHKSSFSLNSLILNNNPLKDITILATTIKQRYAQYWNDQDINNNQVDNSMSRHHHHSSYTISLELILHFGFSNVGVENFDDLFESIGSMIQKSLTFSPIDITLPRDCTLSKVIRKLKNKQYNHRNLQLLKDFYNNEISPLLEIIKVTLDISNNPIINLDSLWKVLEELDCFKSINLSGIKCNKNFDIFSELTQLEQLTCYVTQQELQQLLESENRSLRDLIIQCSKSDLINEIENSQFMITDIKQLE